ncbi:hypothetical protein [Vibrio vulnificus]|uniref:hypothetical protein n=1 Tax=Vibrio vulnificus TaxID=672 RepID=UPI0010295D87|nr:hypothetical protein [Vibrio vulnificus]RZR26462.1 hypothetical protein D8T33_22105 [Vibrio vulnificus]HAS6235739.1 hypothetical protein [Vibrio vulnificus]HDY7447696.1 hypothetical protein [Vibrio vulnificus]HDY7892272.1 hypothetical protein [Vibrio vulnificus]
MNIGIDSETIGAFIVSLILVIMYFSDRKDKIQVLKAFYSNYVYIPSLFFSSWLMLLSVLLLGYGLESWVYSLLSKVISFIAGALITCIIVKLVIDNVIEKSSNLKRDIFGLVTLLSMGAFIKLLDQHSEFGAWLLNFMTPQTAGDPALKIVGDCILMLVLIVSPYYFKNKIKRISLS